MGNSIEQYRASIGSFHCGNKTNLKQCGCKSIRNCITSIQKRPHQIRLECNYYASLWISQLIFSNWSKQSLLIPNSSCMARELDDIEVKVHSPTSDHRYKALSLPDSPIHKKSNVVQSCVLTHECFPPNVSGIIDMTRKKKRRLVKKHVRFDEISSIPQSESLSRQSRKQMCSLYASLWFCQCVLVYPCYIMLSLMLSGDVETNPGPSTTVLGSFSQGDYDRYKHDDVGKQCMAICTVSFMYAIQKQPTLWNSSDLDKILDTGDLLYRNLPARGQYLLPSDLPSYVECLGNNFCLKELNSYTGDVNSATAVDPYCVFSSLLKSLSQPVFCLVCISGQNVTSATCISVIGLQKKWFIFDSHSRNFQGMFSENGSSVMIQCDNVDNSILHIQKLCSQLNTPIFDLTTMSVKSITKNRISQLNKTDDTFHRKHIKLDGICHPDIVPNKDVSDYTLLHTYLNYQDSKEISKKRLRKQQKLSWIRKQRATPEKKEVEREMGLLNKRKQRATPQKKEVEREMGLLNKRKQRSIPEKHDIELEKKRKQRSIPEKHDIELENKRKQRVTPQKKMVEREMGLLNKRKQRSIPEKHDIELEKKRKQRSIPEKHDIELENKRKQRTIPEYSQEECKANREQKRSARKDPVVLEIERVKKQSKRMDAAYKTNETQLDRKRKASLRQSDIFKIQELNSKRQKKSGSTIDDCIGIFHRQISTGPIYVCSSCMRTWFHESVELAQSVLSNKLSENMAKHCLTGLKSVDEQEWVCSTCITAFKANIIPTLAVANKIEFPHKPNELDLYPLEERLVAPRIPFMQLKELPRGRQISLKGNVVNVPCDVNETVHMLPRNFNESQTVHIHFKRRDEYKTNVYSENVRPAKVQAAFQWLMTNSQELYQNLSIQHNPNWCNPTNSDLREYIKNDDQLLESDNKDESFNNVIVADSSNDIMNSCDRDERSADTSNEEHTTNNTNTDMSEDGFIEVDEINSKTGNMDTLLIDDSDRILSFAPGQNQSPLSIFKDEFAEELSFPTIFCGQKRISNNERSRPVHYSQLCKWELTNVDRRAAMSVPNLFFKTCKLQLQQISGKVSFAVRRYKTKGKDIKAGDLCKEGGQQNLVNLDDGYYIFRTLRNSPAYLESKKKHVFAMIRQLGLPTWFLSLSAADTRWTNLIRILGTLVDKKTYTDSEIEEMDWQNRTRLLKSDPITCARFFDHRVKTFIQTVLKSHHHPIGQIQDSFYRVEMQQRGSAHIHMLVWIKNAPKYGINSNQEVTDWMDQYVSCKGDVDETVNEFINLQKHKHTKTCKKYNKPVCRFGFPLAPMSKTTILEPIDIQDEEEKSKNEALFKEITELLNEDKEGLSLSFEEFLNKLNMSEDTYVRVIASNLKTAKVFLKRDPCDIRVNPYFKQILSAWQANHDLQFVLDPYATAMYIVSYINKSQKGMSPLLERACKEAKEGNMDIRHKVRHIGNKFLNSVEICAQEAAFLTLGLPLSKSTRSVIFINTSPPDERAYLLKSIDDLEKMNPDSSDIACASLIDRYGKRPRALQNWCLADYVSQLNITFPKKKTAVDDNDDPTSARLYDENELTDNENDSDDESSNDFSEDNLLKLTFKNGMSIKQRKPANYKVIRYVNYNLKTNKENHYREKLMLFVPWRNEEMDIICGCATYEERFHQVKSVVVDKLKQYAKFSDIIDSVQQHTFDSNNDTFTDIAPICEQENAEARENNSSDLSEFAYFDPDRPIYQREHDIGEDLALQTSRYATNVHEEERLLSKEELLNMVRSLNLKQREFFSHVLHWIKTKSDPIFAFLTGGAGVGKSVVIRTLYQALQRYLCSSAGQDFTNLKILLCAPTGNAAYNIGGITLHKAFALPASQGEIKDLSTDVLNTYMVRYRDLSVVIIDEISMVGNKMLNKINRRLQQIKGNKTDFGGVSMIVVGDLFQLQPVFDNWIFHDLQNAYGPLATNLWDKYFTMFELEEIMRQKDDQSFAFLLNRIREGNHTPDDIKIIHSRIVDPLNFHKYREIPHLCSLNSSVDAHNADAFQMATGQKLSIKALDAVQGNINNDTKEKILTRLTSPNQNNNNKTAGLHYDVNLACGLLYAITVNLDVEDGLTNGVTCTLKHIDFKMPQSSRPSILWVLFEDPNIGKLQRMKYSTLRSPEIDINWTPIFDTKRSFLFSYTQSTGGVSVIRIQFPLTQAAARTVHKAQGSTLNEVMLDIGSRRKWYHMHYVALSRVTKLSGLHLKDFDASQIAVSPDTVTQMEHMRKEKLIELCYGPVYNCTSSNLTIVFHNAQSFRLHFTDIQCDPNFLAADVMCFAESRTKSDDLHRYDIPSFEVYGNDHIKHHGLIYYIKNGLMDSITNYSHPNVEYSVIKIKNYQRGLSCQIVFLYKSPSMTLAEFKDILCEDKLCEAVQHNNLPFIILGDFNENVLDNNHPITDYITNKLHCVQLVTEPTTDYGSALDLIFTNIPHVTVTYLECPWSDHKALCASIRI